MMRRLITLVQRETGESLSTVSAGRRVRALEVMLELDWVTSPSTQKR